MRVISKINKTKLSEDRISMLVLSSLFCVCMTFSGCGKTITMHKANENGETVKKELRIDTTDERNGEGVADAKEQGNELGDTKSNGQESIQGSEQGSGTDSEHSGGKEDQEESIIYKVHVCGAVNEPGVYEVNAEDRVIDAVIMAGGLREDACGDAVNLAAALLDCSRIYVPTVEEVKRDNKGLYASTDISSSTSNDIAGKDSGKVNINTASETELQTITGIGATRAKSIINYRQSNGAFKRIEDITNVSGIGNASFEKMKDMITVD